MIQRQKYKALKATCFIKRKQSIGDHSNVQKVSAIILKHEKLFSSRFQNVEIQF